MDKETMSTYGMILITVMLVATFIIMATPVGEAVLNDIENKIRIVTNNTGVMDVEAQTENYGTVIVHYRYNGSAEDFRVYKTSVRLQEYCNITHPEIDGYEPMLEGGTQAPTKIQITQHTTHMYVYYMPRTYSISYVLNGGKWNTNITYSLQYTHGTSYKLPTGINREGYKFIGWFEDSGLGGVSTTMIEKDDFGDKVFYAKYSVL